MLFADITRLCAEIIIFKHTAIQQTPRPKFKLIRMKLKIAVIILMAVLACKEEEIACSTPLPAHTAQGEDSLVLATFLQETIATARRQACSDPELWTWRLFGSTGCSPSQLLAYPKAEEREIVARMNCYTNLEEEFNDKWGIASICVDWANPIAIECENSEAKLIFSSPPLVR